MSKFNISKKLVINSCFFYMSNYGMESHRISLNAEQLRAKCETQKRLEQEQCSIENQCFKHFEESERDCRYAQELGITKEKKKVKKLPLLLETSNHYGRAIISLLWSLTLVKQEVYEKRLLSIVEEFEEICSFTSNIKKDNGLLEKIALIKSYIEDFRNQTEVTPQRIHEIQTLIFCLPWDIGILCWHKRDKKNHHIDLIRDQAFKTTLLKLEYVDQAFKNGMRPILKNSFNAEEYEILGIQLALKIEAAYKKDYSKNKPQPYHTRSLNEIAHTPEKSLARSTSLDSPDSEKEAVAPRSVMVREIWI